jgi:hypothetical protein
VIGFEAFLAVRCRGTHRYRSPILELDRRHVVLHVNLMTHLDEAITGHFPHLAGAQPGILKLVDERLDRRGPLIERRGGEYRLGERQALDPLRGPFGTDLGTGNSPDFLRVGLEEDQIKPPTKAVGHPLLEVFFDRIGPPMPAKVAQDDSYRVPKAQTLEGVRGLEGIVEIIAVVVDAGEARHLDELVSQDLMPQALLPARSW